MKRSFLSLLFFVLLIFPGHSFGDIVYFEVDDAIELDLLGGFQFDVVGQDVENLTLSTYYQGSSTVIDGISKPGAVYDLAPGYPWSFDITSSNGILAFDNSFGTFPLVSGVILSLESAAGSAFTLDNFILSSSAFPSGFYDLPYTITSRALSLVDGSIYSISNVPIPPAILLLGSGLLGLLGIRRKGINK